MFHLLIVDDEPFIVEGLASLDWKCYEIDMVYKATSGTEALEMMDAYQIDIVITDIKMPGMSGIELIKKSGQGSKKKWILLSGHAEFEYAKQAIQQGAFEYLLKPIADDEIYHSVQRAVKVLKESAEPEFLLKNREEIGDIKPIQSLYEPPQLIHLLEAGRFDAVEKKLLLIFSQLEQEKYHFKEFTMEAYFMISNSFTYIAHRNGQLLIDIIGSNFKKMVDAAQSGTLPELKRLTFSVLEQIKQSIKKEFNHIRMPVIEQVQDYVEKNLNLDISLQSVADHVYLHPAYLSKIYKVETGEGFSEYLYRIKMEKAADLLQDSKRKVYEVSKGLGYNDTSYFIRKFKKHYGITPQEYRNIIIENG